MPMLPNDHLLKIVREDLRFLVEEWNQEVDDASLRRSSTVLRLLLVQGELQRAWKAAGFPAEPEIVTSTLTPTLATFPRSRILFAAAGGAKYRGVELRGVLAIEGASQDEMESNRAHGVPEERLRLRAFIEGPCIVVGGDLVPRRILIKYIANTQGAAHFDRKRPDDHEGRLFRRLDETAQRFKLLDKSAVYFELLSIGQAIVRADDIQRLSETLGTNFNVTH